MYSPDFASFSLQEVFHALESPYLSDTALSDIVYAYKDNLDVIDQVLLNPNAGFETLAVFVELEIQYGLLAMLEANTIPRNEIYELISILVNSKPQWISPYGRARLITWINRGSSYYCLFNEDEWFVEEFLADGGLNELNKAELFNFLKTAINTGIHLKGKSSSVSLYPEGNEKVYAFVIAPVVVELCENARIHNTVLLTAEELSVLETLFIDTSSDYLQYYIYKIIYHTETGQRLFAELFDDMSAHYPLLRRVIHDTALMRDEATASNFFWKVAVPHLTQNTHKKSEEISKWVASSVERTINNSSLAKDSEVHLKFVEHAGQVAELYSENSMAFISMIHSLIYSGLDLGKHESEIIAVLDTFPEDSKAYDFFSLLWNHESKSTSLSSPTGRCTPPSDTMYGKIVEKASFASKHMLLQEGLFPSESLALAWVKEGKFDELDFEEEEPHEYLIESTADVYMEFMAHKDYSPRFKHEIFCRAGQLNMIPYYESYWGVELSDIIDFISEANNIPEELPQEYKKRVLLIGVE